MAFKTLPVIVSSLRDGDDLCDLSVRIINRVLYPFMAEGLWQKDYGRRIIYYSKMQYMIPYHHFKSALNTKECKGQSKEDGTQWSHRKVRS